MLSKEIREKLRRASHSPGAQQLPQTTQNPDVIPGTYASSPWQTNGNGHNGNGKKAVRWVDRVCDPLRKMMLMYRRRYYVTVDDGVKWPPELIDYNKRFTKLLQNIKHRHDPVVTTMGTLPLLPHPPPRSVYSPT